MTASETSQVDSGYAVIMVALDLSVAALFRAKLACRLAERFSSHLIGIGAQPEILSYREVATHPDLVTIEQHRVADELSSAKGYLHTAAGDHVSPEWRENNADPTFFAVEQARAADLIVVGSIDAEADGGPMAVDPGALVLGAGRPVLVVPPDTEYLDAKRIVIGWKDTREARRAVRDALPFLRRAEQVTIVCAGQRAPEYAAGAHEVVNYLARHGVASEMVICTETTGSVCEAIVAAAGTIKADLIVCGGYGYSRMLEWALGGVTRELLHSTQIPCLLSH